MISSRGGRNRSSWRSSRGWLIGLPPTANLAVEGITDRPNQESQTAIKPACTPGFLAKSITCSGQIIAIDQSLPNSSRTTGLFVSLAMTTIVASKPGAGMHHFLPLVPISICVLLSVLQAPASRLAPELNPRDGLHAEKQCQEECM